LQEESVSDAASNLNLQGGQLQLQLDALEPANPFDDYKPPEIDPAFIRDQHANSSDAFEDELADSIRGIAEAEGEEADDRVRKTNSSATSWIRNARDLQWFTQAELFDPGFEWDWLSRAAKSLTDTLVWFDVAYRLLHSIIIIQRFWGRSSLPVAPVDVMKDRDARGRAQVTLQGLQGVAAAVTSPPVLFVLGVVFALAAFLVSWTVYQPIFNAYYEGCVRTEVDVQTGIRYEVGSKW